MIFKIISKPVNFTCSCAIGEFRVIISLFESYNQYWLCFVLIFNFYRFYISCCLWFKWFYILSAIIFCISFCFWSWNVNFLLNYLVLRLFSKQLYVAWVMTRAVSIATSKSSTVGAQERCICSTDIRETRHILLRVIM